MKSQKRKGTVVLVVAICLVMIVALLAFAIDLGYVASTESELQNAADAAAMSAARALPSREKAILAATQWAKRNVAAGEGVDLFTQEDIQIGTWDEETATFTPLPTGSPLTANAVKVICRRHASRGNQLNLFFAPVLGTSHTNLECSAIAQNQGSSCGGIMALEKIYLNDRQVGRASFTDSYDSNQGSYYSQVPGKRGDICTNGHLTLNGNSYVNGDAKWWKQAKAPKATPSQVSGKLESFENPIDFPPINPGNALVVNDNSTIPLSSSGKQPLTGGQFVLSGAGESVTLKPGTYAFTKMTVSNGAKVIITGPTYFYIQGDVDLKTGAVDNVTRRPVNLQFYPMGLNSYFYLPFFGELHACIYSTVAHIYLDEKKAAVNLHFFGKMVGQKIRVWDTALHVDESVAFGRLKSGGEQIGRAGVTLVQ